MGLDMYLTKRHFIWSDDRGSLRIEGARHAIKPERVSEIKEQVGYWRKANAIHLWFVKNMQDGVDNCEAHYVERKNLEQLLTVVDLVLDDHTRAKELLPTAEGFFFGGTEYDEYYFEDLVKTKDILTELLAEKTEGEIYYQSSW